MELRNAPCASSKTRTRKLQNRYFSPIAKLVQHWYITDMEATRMTTLICQAHEECSEAVTHIDNKGFVYCEKHGKERRSSHPCRYMRRWEIERLRNGVPI